jgi:hypothetical protein
VQNSFYTSLMLPRDINSLDPLGLTPDEELDTACPRYKINCGDYRDHFEISIKSQHMRDSLSSKVSSKCTPPQDGTCLCERTCTGPLLW